MGFERFLAVLAKKIRKRRSVDVQPFLTFHANMTSKRQKQMQHIVITGAASGLGKAFLDALKHKDATIYAMDIAFAKSHASMSSDTPSRSIVEYIPIDITSETQIEMMKSTFAKDNIYFDLFIHCAGVRGLVPTIPIGTNKDIPGAEDQTVMDARTLERTLSVNTVGGYLSMHLAASAMRGMPKKQNPNPKVVVMGSSMGSIAQNETGGAYAYRASKAGLNAIVKSCSIEVKQVTWVVVHPGRVESSLTPVKEDGAIEAEESVKDMLKLIEGLEKKDSGRFVDRFGKDIPW